MSDGAWQRTGENISIITYRAFLTALQLKKISLTVKGVERMFTAVHSNEHTPDLPAAAAALAAVLSHSDRTVSTGNASQFRQGIVPRTVPVTWMKSWLKFSLATRHNIEIVGVIMAFDH